MGVSVILLVLVAGLCKPPKLDNCGTITLSKNRSPVFLYIIMVPAGLFDFLSVIQVSYNLSVPSRIFPSQLGCEIPEERSGKGTVRALEP